jgi:copper homeostasis protein
VLIKQCLALGVPCVAMARPRAGKYIYGPDQMKQLRATIKLVFDAGATGVVFGVLAGDGSIDAITVAELVNQCDGRDTVFHRAFDTAPYARRALDTLVACGVTRVLTSGQRATAFEGIPVLKSLVEQAAGRIQILPGGAVRGENVVELVERTGVTQVHARATDAGVIAGIRAALER